MCKSGGQAISEGGNWTGLLQEGLRYSEIFRVAPHPFSPELLSLAGSKISDIQILLVLL